MTTKKSLQVSRAFTHILLGRRSDQHLTRFSSWERPVGAQSASAHFKLNWFGGLCGVWSAECGVWKMRSVENAKCGNLFI